MGAFDALSDRPVWVAWQVEDTAERPDSKIPYSPGTQGQARVNAPSTWGTRASAEDRAQRLPKPKGVGGVGIVLGEGILPDAYLCGIDLDTCRDPALGKMDPWAEEIIARFGSYTEVSPSKTGVKVFFQASLADVAKFRDKARALNSRTWSRPTGRRHPPAVELHLSHRYFAVTGDRMGAVDELRRVPLADLLWLAEDAGPRLRARKEKDKEAERPATLTADDISEAFTLIDNDDLDWDRWNTVAMAVYAASNGEDWGFAIFDGFSQRSAKYNAKETRGRWDALRGSPPSQITAGSIVWWAREAQPDWTPPSQRGGPATIPTFSDENMALRFAERHDQTLRFTAEFNQWHHWTGDRWQRDKTLYAFDLVRDLCRCTAPDAPAATRSNIVSAKKVAAVTTLVRSDRRLVATGELWDRDPWVLGVPGATVDLRTGLMRDPDIKDYITQLTRVTPGVGGGCPLWERAMLEICGGDPGRVAYLRRVGGYLITGLTREEKVFFLYGMGRNGKGTYVETLMYVLGDYATTVGMNTLIQTRHQEHPTEIAKLRGVRLAVASETQDGMRWNGSRLKLLSGGDRLTGRFMRGDYFDFWPTHKLVVSSNRQPMLGTVDHAIAARMELIPFAVTFLEPDVTLKERLKEEAPGILAWFIEGCLLWQRDGLATPKDVKAATEEYISTQDDMALFLSDCTEEDQTVRLPVSTFYAPFQEWCQRTGSYCCSKKEFTQRLRARGLAVEHGAHNVAYVRGLRLGEAGRQPGEDEDDGDAVPM